MQRIAVLAVALLTPVIVAAHSGHSDEPIKARRAYFTLIGANMGALGRMAKGEIDYNPDIAAIHARNLGGLLSYNIAVHFPEGTSQKDHPGKTRALQTIWEGDEQFNPAFIQKGEEFYAAINALGSETSLGRDALRSALSRAGATCKGCHDDFRAKDF